MTNPSIQLFLDAFGWRAVLDISLISLAVLFTYRTLRRLGTWKIVVGLFAAGVVFLLANLLHLEGIRWIYTHLSHVALLGLIVMFQPELRKIFERAVSPGHQRPGDHESLPELLADALFMMAKERRGAILVFPGKESVAEFLHGGIPLDAQASIPLVLSVFDPHSPGHDGAMLVEDGKLSRYAVRLPISHSDDLPQEFGTRHHAGMGLSERCDALVLVVSEERGTVTLFRDGKTTRVQRHEDAAVAIRAHWEQTGTYLAPFAERSTRRRAVGEYAVAWLCTAVLWSGVGISQGQMLERTLAVPVEYTATPPTLALAGVKPDQVRLHLAGPRSDLDALNASHVRVRVDMSDATPGTRTFIVSRENVDLPSRVQLLDADPAELTVQLEAVVVRDVTVSPQLVGSLRQGLHMAAVEVKPVKVRALTAADPSQGDLTITTTPIYLSSIGATTRIFCKLIAPPNVQPADKRWPDVEVHLVVEATQENADNAEAMQPPK